MAIAFTIPGGSVQLGGNPIWINVTGAAAPAGSTRYQVLLKITSTDSLVPGGPFIDAIAPDVSGACQFDISGRVNRPMTPDFEYPLVGAIKSYIDSAWNVSVETGESYIDSNGDLQETWHNNSQLIQILKGGISDYLLGLYNDNDTTFFKEWIEAGKFLTHQPNYMRVSPSQPVKLFLISPFTENTECNLLISAMYDDGSNAGVSTPFVLYRDGLFEFSVSPDHNGLPTTKTTGEKMLYFTVTWSGGGNIYSENSRTYFIDWTYYENNTYLFAANSIGGIDVLWLTGEVKKTIDVTRTEGFKPREAGAGIRTRTLVTTGVTGRRKWTVNTGYKENKAEIEALEDVYLSEYLWLLWEGQLVPVTLENGEQLLSDTMLDLHSAELVLMEANNLKYR